MYMATAHNLSPSSLRVNSPQSIVVREVPVLRFSTATSHTPCLSANLLVNLTKAGYAPLPYAYFAIEQYYTFFDKLASIKFFALLAKFMLICYHTYILLKIRRISNGQSIINISKTAVYKDSC